MPSIEKFKWSEIFNNNNGKTSGSGFSGVITIMVGLLGFISGIAMYFFEKFSTFAPDVISSSVLLIGIGASLLGVRKIWKEDKKIEIDNNEKK